MLRGRKRSQPRARAALHRRGRGREETTRAHKVTFALPKRSLGREDVELVVKKDGVRFGTLLVRAPICALRRRRGLAGRRARASRHEPVAPRAS